MKWIGQHIYDLVSRFRDDVYFENDLYIEGNVGIGTNFPEYPLEISITHAGSDDDKVALSLEPIKGGNQIIGDGVGILFKTSGAGLGNIGAVGAYIGSHRDNATDANTSTGLTFKVSQNDTTYDDVMTIDSDGNVGIGTTSPDQLLDIESGNVGATAPTIRITNTNNEGSWTDNEALGGLEFYSADVSGTPGAGVKASLRAINTNGPYGGYVGLQFNIADSTSNDREVMRLDNDGDVGIGTTVPQEKLHIAGDDDSNVGLLMTSYDSDTDYNYPYISLFRARGTQASPSIVADDDFLGGIRWGGWLGSTGGDYYTNYDIGASIYAIVDGTPSNANEDIPTALIFATCPGAGTTVAERMRISPDGNVGVGVADPDAPLEVQYTTEATATAVTNNRYGLKITGDDTGTTGESSFLFLSATNGAARGAYIAAERMGTGNQHDLIFANSASSEQPTENMRINSLGQVGVGVTKPGERILSTTGCSVLEVGGTPNAADDGATLVLRNLDTSIASGDVIGSIKAVGDDINSTEEGLGAEIKFQSSGTWNGTTYDYPANIGFFTNDGTTGSSSAFAERMIVRANGNVGIGTTDPQQQLDVGALAGGTMSLSRTDTTITDGNAIGRLYFSGLDDTWDIGAQIAAYATQTWNGGSAIGTRLTFATAADNSSSISERMRIEQDGSVGIGDTSPVAGAGNLTINGLTINTYDITPTDAGAVIPDGKSLVLVGAHDDADHIIILPTAVKGRTVRLIHSEDDGYELRSSNPAGIAINGGVGTDFESAIDSWSIVDCTCLDTNWWVCTKISTTGVTSAVEVAAA